MSERDALRVRVAALGATLAPDAWMMLHDLTSAILGSPTLPGDLLDLLDRFITRLEPVPPSRCGVCSAELAKPHSWCGKMAICERCFDRARSDSLAFAALNYLHELRCRHRC